MWNFQMFRLLTLFEDFNLSCQQENNLHIHKNLKNCTIGNVENWRWKYCKNSFDIAMASLKVKILSHLFFFVYIVNVESIWTHFIQWHQYIFMPSNAQMAQTAQTNNIISSQWVNKAKMEKKAAEHQIPKNRFDLFVNFAFNLRIAHQNEQKKNT